MNVEEVTATLHKIAAANPAFRGNLLIRAYTQTCIEKIYVAILLVCEILRTISVKEL